MQGKKVNFGKKSERIAFSRMNYDVQLPNLLEIQKNSFEYLLNYGIASVIRELSPFEGHKSGLKLNLSDPIFSEVDTTIAEAKKYDANYKQSIRVKVSLKNAETGELKEDECLLCELPLMTPSATFVINGAERVIVSQIVRSSGAYFRKIEADNINCELIPIRGCWIEFLQDKKGILYANFDKDVKVPLTLFCRALGLRNDVKLTSDNKTSLDVIFDKNLKYINKTFEREAKIFEPARRYLTPEKWAEINEKLFGIKINKENSTPYASTSSKQKLLDEAPHIQLFVAEKFSDAALAYMYGNIKNLDKFPIENAREYFYEALFENKKYDLGRVGRYKFNRKLDIFVRIENKFLASDFKDEKGNILLPKNTLLNAENLEVIKQHRNLLKVLIVKKENSVEASANIFGDLRYNKANEPEIVINKSIKLVGGDEIVRKGTILNDDIIKKLSENRNNLDDNVINFFLTNNPYDTLKNYHDVYVEVLDVKLTPESKESFRIVGNDPDSTYVFNYVVSTKQYDKSEKLNISLSDIFASINYYLNIEKNIGMLDDIDNLENRRVRPVGELLLNQFRIGLRNCKKDIENKINSISFENLDIKKIFVISKLEAEIKKFFGSSQLSQFMDQINPLAELTQKRRISALGPGGLSRKHTGVEARDVHPTHYGRICPIETPEGQANGLITSLASYARVDSYGFIQTPYLVVKNSKVINEEVYLSVPDELNKVIASASTKLDEEGNIVDDVVVGRLNWETKTFKKEEVNYIDVSSKQVVSVATSTIPFLEHDDATRALMGANMQRQAVPLIVAESPIVGTGIEYRAAKDSGVTVVSDVSGYVTFVDASKVIISIVSKEVSFEDALINVDKKVFELSVFNRSNQESCILQRPIVKYGEYVDEGDILADGSSTQNGELALGKNVTVAFMTWDGYNYEDAVIMCEDLVKNDVYTSIHIEKHTTETRSIKGLDSKEEITADIAGIDSKKKQKLNTDPTNAYYGTVLEGTEVAEDDILVAKITPKEQGEDSGIEDLVNTIFDNKSTDYRNTSLTVPHGSGGIVKEVQIFNRKDKKANLKDGVLTKVNVFTAVKRKIQEGDKMAGRHGNKGVISKILPREDMPYLEDGTPVDILLNPLGVPSRMNIGQILEVHLGLAARNQNIKVTTPVFDGVSDEVLVEQMQKGGLTPDGKVTIYDGRTGQPFSNKVTVGVMYMLKLSHMVDDKMHARNTDKYQVITQQPMGGKANNGGQRFGEMEVWALYAYGAAYTLREILTIKSDDLDGRERAFKNISKGEPIGEPSLPESFMVMAHNLQSFGLYVELIESKDQSNAIYRTRGFSQKEKKK